jgi:hypothetical protein
MLSKVYLHITACHSLPAYYSLPAKVALFLVKNKQFRFFLHISSFYSEKYCIFALANALVAKLVDALDLGSSGSGRVGSSPIRRTEGSPNCLIISS